MADLARGLYEILITEALDRQLGELDERLSATKAELRSADAADRLALHVGRLLRRALGAVDDGKRVEVGVRLARQIVDDIARALDRTGAEGEAPVAAAEVLRAILGRRPDGSAETMATPLIPLLDTTLLTNAPGEPRVGNQLLTEIHSADRIDVVMAFIRRTGIRPLLGALRNHCERGQQLRMLTTTYTGSTEQEALEELVRLGADVRVSYDESTTRLHAKAWLFHRRSGYSTAYIGSSNLTHSAR